MKIRLLYLVLIALAMFLSVSCIMMPENRDDNPDDDGNQRFYRVGDIGPGKGIVFYDKTYYGDDTWRYLEAAPADNVFEAAWGLFGISCSDTELGIGKGKENTDKIVSLLGNAENDKAAQLCRNLTINGKSDWYLPSREELNVFYWVLARDSTLTADYFDIDELSYYWSSSAGTTENKYTWFKRFSDGAMFLFIDAGNDRNEQKKVVPIRRF